MKSPYGRLSVEVRFTLHQPAWECYSTTPSWCQLASLPRGHLTKHDINSRSTEILRNNKRKIQKEGFSMSESNICFLSCDLQQNYHWNACFTKRSIYIFSICLFSMQLTAGTMSLLINQLKDEYSFRHEWKGMQGGRVFYLSLVFPVLLLVFQYLLQSNSWSSQSV